MRGLALVRAALLGAAVGFLVGAEPRAFAGMVCLLAAFWITDDLAAKR